MNEKNENKVEKNAVLPNKKVELKDTNTDSSSAKKTQKDTKNKEKTAKKHEKTAKNREKIEKHNRKPKKEEKSNDRKLTGGAKGAIITLSILTGVLGASTIGLGIACGMTNTDVNAYGAQLEGVYQKNYYELVDNVNSADTEMGKLLNSTNSTYQRKMLASISNSAKNMQNNISNLPLQGENVLESVRFINQLSGYLTTLEEKVIGGEELTEDDIATLQELQASLSVMKDNLNDMAGKMMHGYSILSNSEIMSGDLNSFTIDFEQIKNLDVDYPTMIYDGPFADAVVNKEIVGLTGDEVTQDEAQDEVASVFSNISNISFESETNGNFSTYNFRVKNTDEQELFVQVTKQGAHILSVSGQNSSTNASIDYENAEKIALDFAKANGVENAEVVWSGELNHQMYFNIAPKQDGVILYPDLVKVKVDLEHGNVIGYDAIAYWTNHTERTLAEANDMQLDIPSTFTIVQTRLVLAPLDYNREVLCYESECTNADATYYFYFNAETGVQENILKVVYTDDSSKLM